MYSKVESLGACNTSDSLDLALALPLLSVEEAIEGRRELKSMAGDSRQTSTFGSSIDTCRAWVVCTEVTVAFSIAESAR